MRTYAEKLTSATSYMKCGNHKVIFTETGREFIYWSTAICVVNDVEKTFYTDNGGYNTSSTNRAINQYRCYFTERGYKEVGKNEF
jgi:hypothetical protein